jgi:hypothetical protein
MIVEELTSKKDQEQNLQKNSKAGAIAKVKRSRGTGVSGNTALQ